MTPEELEKQRQQEQRKRDNLQKKLQLAQTIAKVSVSVAGSQLTGLDKVNQSINTKIASLQNKAVEQLSIIASELGIEGLETGTPNLPNLCPPATVLQRVSTIRDNYITEIQATAKYINIIDSSLQIVKDLLNGSITTLTALNILKTASSAATKLIPTVPGAVTALLSDLDDIRTLVTFKTDGNPRLPELQRAVDLGATYISEASLAINSILTLLSFVDQVLAKCGQQVASIPSDILSLTTPVTNLGGIDTVYKGFTFEIVERYFSPTLNQKIGQAKNNQGVVLLQTEPSFTQDPQVLIEELKFIIDRDNLKADAGPESNLVNPQPITPSTPPVAPANQTNATTATTNLDLTPIGFAGTSIGEQAGIPVGIGNSEDIYEWTGTGWIFVGTRDI